MRTDRRNSVLLLAALLFNAAAQAGPAADEILVEDAYVRAVPPGMTVTAAFMELNNTSSGEHALVAAQSPAAEAVELHAHTMEDGMMSMYQVQRIEVPAGMTVKLEPGGLHVMLIGLMHPLAPGDEVKVTLHYQDGSLESLQVPVRKVKAMMH